MKFIAERMIFPAIATALLLSLLPIEEAALAAPKKKDAVKEELPTAPPPTKKEFLCQGSVNYSWQRSSADKQQTGSATDNQISQQDQDREKPIEVFAELLQAKADSEQQAREDLSVRSTTSIARAMEACTQDHESQSRCISGKLSTFGPDYRMWDFERRRAALDAVSKDCTSRIGYCIGAKLSEVICTSKDVLPPAASENTGSSEGVGFEKAKDKKSKKK